VSSWLFSTPSIKTDLQVESDGADLDVVSGGSQDSIRNSIKEQLLFLSLNSQFVPVKYRFASIEAKRQFLKQSGISLISTSLLQLALQ